MLVVTIVAQKEVQYNTTQNEDPGPHILHKNLFRASWLRAI
jgi:hypothetical protein